MSSFLAQMLLQVADFKELESLWRRGWGCRKAVCDASFYSGGSTFNPRIRIQPIQIDV